MQNNQPQKELVVPDFCLRQKCPPHCNRIMVSKQGKTIYLPTYIMINIRNFKDLKFEELIAQICSSLTIIIYVQGLPKEIISNLKNLVINLPLHGNIPLNENSIKDSSIDLMSRELYSHHLKNNFICQSCRQYGNIDRDRLSQSHTHDNDGPIFKQYKIQTNFKTTVDPKMFLTPFQIVDLILTVSIKTINLSYLDKDKQKSTQIKFVMMDTNSRQQSQIQKKINFNANGVFGQYDLAQKKLHVQYSTSAQQKSLEKLGKSIFPSKVQDQKLQPQKKVEQYAHFHLPLYKFPYVPLMTIMIPLVVLGIINLATFYQGPGLGDRIGNISALMIAFIGIVPVIRKSIPRTPIITGVEILVYLETFTTIFCLIESLRNRHQDTIMDVSQSIYFQLSLIITILVTVIPFGLLLVHQSYLKHSYNQNVNELKQDFKQYLRDWNRNDLKYTFFFQKIRQKQILIQIKPNERSKKEYSPSQYVIQQDYETQFRKILKKIGKCLREREQVNLVNSRRRSRVFQSSQMPIRR